MNPGHVLSLSVRYANKDSLKNFAAYQASFVYMFNLFALGILSL